MVYSVCIPAVLGKLPMDQALEAVKRAGFAHYEFWGWTAEAIETYQKEQERLGLHAAALCTRFVPLTDAARRDEYVRGLEETIQACKRLKCRMIISQVGQELPGVSRAAQHQSIVQGLRACAPLLEQADMTLVIEPLNTRIDHRGYYLWRSQEAFEIVDEVASPCVKVLFDLYHQHIMSDLSIDAIVAHIDRIGHFHMAGYPGRHEPMIESEIDYPAILRAIEKSGYAGAVGLEYFPVRDAAEGLKALHEELRAL